MGIGAIQGVDAIPSPTPVSEVVKIVIQVVIGLITAWQMLKKPKNTDSNQQNK
ncbi:MAG: hypothetical protein ABI441_13770 [Flavobacterium sp.]